MVEDPGIEPGMFAVDKTAEVAPSLPSSKSFPLLFRLLGPDIPSLVLEVFRNRQILPEQDSDFPLPFAFWKVFWSHQDFVCSLRA